MGVLGRLAPGAVHAALRRQVQDRRRLPGLDRLASLRFGDVGHLDARLLGKATVRGVTEVVDDQHLGAGREQRFDAVHADEPCPAGDDDTRGLSRGGHQFLLTSARRKSAVLAGRSAMRRMRYPYHWTPKGT